MDSSDFADPETLILALREHPEQTLSELFTTYRSALKQIVAARLDKRLLGRVDPSDILQETLIEASKRLHEYLDAPNMPFKKWLGFLAEQNAVAAYRWHFQTQKRSVGRENQAAESSTENPMEALVNDITDPQDRAIRGESNERLRDSIDQLADSDQAVIRMRYFEGMKIQAIADKLGITKDAASKRVMRAIKRLSEMMDDDTSI